MIHFYRIILNYSTLLIPYGIRLSTIEGLKFFGHIFWIICINLVNIVKTKIQV